MYTQHYHYAAFDMDGTLLDTMRFWRRSVEEYLRTHGRIQEADALGEKLKYMPITTGMEYISDICTGAGIPPMTWDNLYNTMGAHYAHDAVPKPGVTAFLQELQRAGVRMCIATATPRRLTDIALECTGLRPFFDFVLTPEDYPKGKKDRAFFDGILARFGSTAADTAMFEDALYSLRTAKSLGFYCVGIEDSYAAHDRAAIRMLADEYYVQYEQG